MFISNVLARAEADANVKSKLSAQIVSLKATMEQENENPKISQKSMLTDDIATADTERDGLYSGYKKAVWLQESACGEYGKSSKGTDATHQGLCHRPKDAT